MTKITSLTAERTNLVWSYRWIRCRWWDWMRCYRTRCSAQRM